MTTFTPSNLDYLRKLHDLAYIANKADSGDDAEPWQVPSMASTHCQPLLDIVRSMMTEREFETFLDCFGDFDSFVANVEREAKDRPTLRNRIGGLLHIKPQEMRLPTAWAYYLTYGHDDALSAADVAEIDAWIEENYPLAFDVLDVSEESYFSRYHEADGGNYVLTQVSDYTVRAA